MGGLIVVNMDEVKMALVEVEGYQVGLVDEEAQALVDEVAKRVGTVTCDSCGISMRTREAGLLRILDNGALEALCGDCLQGVLGVILELIKDCLHGPASGINY